ncbi:MAG: hypothetical protein H6540_05565 [Bacteroidales bacterium]|nr:hypothetical protein [Bacteroidales bacterium]
MVSILKYGSKTDKILGLLQKLNKSNRKGIDSSKYSGTIILSEDSLRIQKKLRDEWE